MGGGEGGAALFTELGLEREGLAFIGGFVAYKLPNSQPSLGCRTSEATEQHLASVPSSWLMTISRGRLHVPHAWWMAVVEQFNADFCNIMGPTFNGELGIIRRLVGVIRSRYPKLDLHVARRLARVRLHVRINWLRQSRLRSQPDPRVAKQLHQHVTSQCKGPR